MFSPVTLDPVGFKTISSSKREYDDKSVQTDLPIVMNEKEIQTAVRTDCEVQTDMYKLETNQSVDFNKEKLAAFLSKVTPSVMSELDKIEKSKAFTFYRTREDGEKEEVKDLFKLHPTQPPKDKETIVTVLDWSCTGNVIAVGFGIPYHPEWCTHSSAVHFYNISKYNFDGSPTSINTTTSCITAIAYHPFEPYIIAVGTYSGEILIWNLQKDGEDMRFENSIFHEDKVTQLVWVTINSQLYLFSSSIDGYVFSFKISPGLGSTILVDRFTFVTFSTVPKPGVSCIGFQPGQMGAFVASLEGGKLIHCSTIAASEVTGTSLVVKDPTVKVLKPQTGIVICISFSPYVDHMFCTATGEKKFVVHSINEWAPLIEVWPNFEIMGVSWSWAQGNAIFAWGMGSQVLVYDSESGNHLEEIQPEKYGDREITIFFAAQSRKSPKLLAVGSGTEVYVWEIPRFFKSKFSLV